MRLFVDLDGVMANFHRGACPLFQVPYPRQSVLHFEWLFNQTGTTVEDFLGRIDATPGFWEKLEPFPWLPELIQILDTACPNWQILTFATQDPVSWQGKAAWVKRVLGADSIRRLVMIHGDKERLASPDALLVDDHRRWCQNWKASGGLDAFHWIEYTEDHQEMWSLQLARLRDFLSQFTC